MSAPDGDLWFESREFRVLQRGDVLEIRRRPNVLFVLGGAGILAGLGMRLLGVFVRYRVSMGLGQFLGGAGALLGVAAVLAVVIGLLQLVSPGMAVVYRVDRAAKRLITQREGFPWNDVTGWELTTMPGGFPAIRFQAAGRSQYLLSAEPSKRPALEALLPRLHAWLGPEADATLPAHAPTPVPSSLMSSLDSTPDPSGDATRRLGAWTLIVLGALWSGAGFFLFRGLNIFDSRGVQGPPVWTFGLFFMAMGVFRMFRRASASPSRSP